MQVDGRERPAEARSRDYPGWFVSKTNVLIAPVPALPNSARNRVVRLARPLRRRCVFFSWSIESLLALTFSFAWLRIINTTGPTIMQSGAGDIRITDNSANSNSSSLPASPELKAKKSPSEIDHDNELTDLALAALAPGLANVRAANAAWQFGAASVAAASGKVLTIHGTGQQSARQNRLSRDSLPDQEPSFDRSNSSQPLLASARRDSPRLHRRSTSESSTSESAELLRRLSLGSNASNSSVDNGNGNSHSNGSSAGIELSAFEAPAVVSSLHQRLTAARNSSNASANASHEESNTAAASSSTAAVDNNVPGEVAVVFHDI